MSFITPEFTIGNARGLIKFVLVSCREANIVPKDNDGWSRLAASETSNSLARRATGHSLEIASGGSSGSGDASSNSTEVATKNDNSLEAIVTDILLSTVASIVLYTLGVGLWTVSKSLVYALTGQDGSDGDVDTHNTQATSRLHEILKKRGREPKRPLRLTSHETHLAEDIIDSDDIDESFADIGGMDNLKQEIWELAILPLLRPELFRTKSKLLQQPSGILLYGKPGCGKTLLAKAIAKESSAAFIPIKLSKILNKWVGESNKLVAATFSLARKLAPSVIFLDEVHCFLSDSVDPSASKSMESLKAEFLTLWDGVSTNGNHAPVLVLGATNHPHLIDQAILRRMPRTFAVPLPGPEGRLQILKVMLQDQPMTEDAHNYLKTLAKNDTKGYSGSDLKELCRTAAREPIREIVKEEARRAVSGERPIPKTTENGEEEEEDEVRPVCKNDFKTALTKVKRTGEAAKQYGRAAAGEDAAQDAAAELMNMDPTQLMALLNKFQETLLGNGHNRSSSPDDASSVGDSIGDVPPPLPE